MPKASARHSKGLKDLLVLVRGFSPKAACKDAEGIRKAFNGTRHPLSSPTHGEEGPHDDQAPDPGGRREPGAAGGPGAGPARGQHHGVLQGVQCQTQPDAGTIIPVEITVFEDRSFEFITKTPP